MTAAAMVLDLRWGFFDNLVIHNIHTFGDCVYQVHKFNRLKIKKQIFTFQKKKNANLQVGVVICSPWSLNVRKLDLVCFDIKLMKDKRNLGKKKRDCVIESHNPNKGEERKVGGVTPPKK
jgi:hypothetical protein